MKWLPFLLLLALACSPQPESRARRATPPDCDPAAFTIEDGALPAPPASGADSAAAATGRMTLANEGICHEFALEFPGGATGGSLMRSFGIVRFPLRASLAGVGQADSAFADSTIAAAYVVHGLDGAYFLDVHLAGPAKASSRPRTDPRHVGVTLAVGGGAIPVPAPRARNVVVLEPRGGAARYPLTVRGYARTFEANVQGWIEGSPGTRTHTTAADWSQTWGEFELTIPSGPSGDVKLFVGEESAQDGTPIGVTIPLRMP
jgi:hypothetical protein